MLQIICATPLTAEEVTVHNIPDILDVNNLIQLMRDMGVNVSKKGIDTYSFQAANVDFAYMESDEFLKRCSSLRGSVMLVGPMVARFGKAMISKPGGDKIGRRRIQEVLFLYKFLSMTGGNQGGFVADIGDVGAGESRSLACQ